MTLSKRAPPLTISRLRTSTDGRQVDAELRKLGVSFDDEDMMSARLYTGPMYKKYNAVLRAHWAKASEFDRRNFEDLCHGN